MVNSAIAPVNVAARAMVKDLKEKEMEEKEEVGKGKAKGDPKVGALTAEEIIGRVNAPKEKEKED